MAERTLVAIPDTGRSKVPAVVAAQHAPPCASKAAGPAAVDYRQVPLTATATRHEEATDEPPTAVELPIPKDNDEVHGEPTAAGAVPVRLGAAIDPAGVTTGPLGIATVLRPGGRPQTFAASIPGRPADAVRAQATAPGGTPTEGNGSNDCTPDVAGSVLGWDVVSADATNWAVSVTSLTLKGVVNVKPWPSNPTTMTVPNTANPVDGGNIENRPGSSNHWKAAIDDMADYHTAGGGAGPDWHSTDASHAHEWAHWNTDYLTDSVASAAGGNWGQTNTDLDALRQPKAASASAADARAALQGRVDARFATWKSKTVTRWNAIPDTPGVAGSTGYVAGARVLAGLITSVRAYATTKGWNAPPAPARPPVPGP